MRVLIIACFFLSLLVTGAAAADRRILVMGAEIAEIVIALGEAGNVVGRGAGSDPMPEVAHAARFPGFRQASAEGMLSLKPSIALMSRRQTSDAVAAQLEAAGVELHLFGSLSNPTLEQAPERIRDIGAALGKQEQAERLAARYDRELAAVLARLEGVTTRPRGVFILSGGGRRNLIAGGDTYISLLINLAGGENVAEELRYFKPMSREAMIAAAPEFILVNTEGLEDSSAGAPAVMLAPGVKLTPAAQADAVFSLPNGLLTDVGLSTPRAIELLARKLHPELWPVE